MDRKIIFFDIAGRSPIPYSPNTWKVRLALNYKGLPYSTRYLQIADIEDTCKFLDIPPSGEKPNGEPHYTLPAIIDNIGPHKMVKISDSRPIIEYLERTYPPEEGKELFSEGTREFQDKVQELVLTRIFPHAPFLWLLDYYKLKTPRDKDHLRRRMEARFGKSLEEIVAKGNEWQHRWEAFRQAMSEIDALALAHSANEGPFMLGQQVTFADMMVCGFLIFFKASASEEYWSQVASWNNGRWDRLLKAFEPWMKFEDYTVWEDYGFN